MTLFLFAVLAYVTLQVAAYITAVCRDTYPRRLSLLLVGLGVWAYWLLLG